MPLKGTMIIDSPLATTGQCGEGGVGQVVENI